MIRLWPQSVIGRVFAALLLTVVFINIASLTLYVVFHDETAAAAAASQAADQIIVIRRLVDRVTPREGVALINRLSSPLMNMRMTQEPIVEQSDDQFASRVVLKKLFKEFPKGTDIRVDSRIELRGFDVEKLPLDEAILRSMSPSWDQENFRLDPLVPKATDETAAGENPAPSLLDRLFERRSTQRLIAMNKGLPALDEALFNVSIRSPDMRVWFNARVLLNLGEPAGQSVPFLWLTAFSFVIGGIAWWGVLKATRPLTLFAAAAERLGVDVNAEPLDEDGGPSEVRRATQAFNTMQTRIRRFIQDRTQMLAAISHDLRTPLTRMRLRAEFVDDDVQRQKMFTDLDEMEAMIGATLTFARDDAANEPLAAVDVAAIVASLCSDQQMTGRDVSYSGPDTFVVTARPLALKRAINNFIDNAVKYGKLAQVTLSVAVSEFTITIDDQGPGIADIHKERVFAPFVRLETSRSRETGGAGLGLTIARSAVRSMGGDVELVDRKEGGLRVRVTLPITQEDTLAMAAE